MEILRESKTAKEPGREIFNQMLTRMERGEAHGVLAWHPDRLARNSIDGGKIIYLMDLGIIQSLKFPTYWVDTTPQGKFTLSLAFGQSKYYIDNLSQNVKRGHREKLRRGEWPAPAVIGYKNELSTHKIIPDPKVFPIIQRMFTEYAQGIYSLRELADETYSWGLTNRNGKKITSSSVQRILQNPFYMGIMVFNGKKYKGIHKKAVNTGTFLQVQKVMKNRGKPTYMKRKASFFPFTGLLKCSECGCSITAEMQKGHKYYRCTKKKGSCNQKYVREEVLVRNLDKILKQISIDEELFKLMIEAQRLGQKEEYDSHIDSLKFWQNEFTKIEEQKKRLLDIFTSGKITEDEYEDKKNELIFQQTEVEESMEELKNAGNQWIEQKVEFITVCHMAHLVFEKGNSYDKKLILHTVGSNFFLKGENVEWDWVKPFDVMVKNDECLIKRGGRDSNPRPFA